MNYKQDIEADMLAAKDRGESTALMEPVLIGETSRERSTLTDLAVELAQKSAGFRRSLPESLVTSLSDLVRAMNCYYSNLIEGHDTHPVDIERALKNDYSNDPRKRDLQLRVGRRVRRFLRRSPECSARPAVASGAGDWLFRRPRHVRIAPSRGRARSPAGRAWQALRVSQLPRGAARLLQRSAARGVRRRSRGGRVGEDPGVLSPRAVKRLRGDRRSALIAASIGLAIAPLPRPLVERWYSNGVYPALQPVLTSTSNLAPVALFDVLLVAVALPPPRRPAAGIAGDAVAGSLGLQFGSHHAHARDAHLSITAKDREGRRRSGHPGH